MCEEIHLLKKQGQRLLEMEQGVLNPNVEKISSHNWFDEVEFELLPVGKFKVQVCAEKHLSKNLTSFEKNKKTFCLVQRCSLILV
jgi:hypothetical protein